MTLLHPILFAKERSSRIAIASAIITDATCGRYVDVAATKVPYFIVTKMESRGETKRCQEAATPCLGAGHPLAVPRGGVAPSGAHRPRSSAYLFI
jgi:hypothetical protein